MDNHMKGYNHYNVEWTKIKCKSMPTALSSHHLQQLEDGRHGPTASTTVHPLHTSDSPASHSKFTPSGNNFIWILFYNSWGHTPKKDKSKLQLLQLVTRLYSDTHHLFSIPPILNSFHSGLAPLGCLAGVVRPSPLNGMRPWLPCSYWTVVAVLPHLLLSPYTGIPRNDPEGRPTPSSSYSSPPSSWWSGPIVPSIWELFYLPPSLLEWGI